MPKAKIPSKSQNKRKIPDSKISSSPETIEEEDDLIEKFDNTKKNLSTNEASFSYASDQENADEGSAEPLHNATIGNETARMLDMFKLDINKSMLAKRKKMEKFTSAVINSNQNKMIEMWNSQHKSRNLLLDEFGRKIGEVLNQWDSEFVRQKEQEEKVQKIILQQAKVIEQQRTSHLHKLDSLRKIHGLFTKDIEKLEAKHMELLESVKEEMKQEILLLQKRSLMEIQQQEMQNVRKSLQTIFLP